MTFSALLWNANSITHKLFLLSQHVSQHTPTFVFLCETKHTSSHALDINHYSLFHRPHPSKHSGLVIYARHGVFVKPRSEYEPCHSLFNTNCSVLVLECCLPSQNSYPLCTSIQSPECVDTGLECSPFLFGACRGL